MKQQIGEMNYGIAPSGGQQASDPLIPIISGIVTAIVVVCIVIAGYFVNRKIRTKIAKERQTWEYKLDKMEGRFRNQCRAGKPF